MAGGLEMDAAVQAFRDWLVGEYRADASFERVESLEGPEAGGADLSVRLHLANRSYYEARVDLAGGQLQAGFSTEGRMINEAIEQSILDSGGDLSELLADELADLGEAPLPMEHFWERPAFRYIVRLPLAGPEALADAALRSRVKTIFKACRILFQEAVDEG